MILSHRLQAAIDEAARLHRDQIRKDERQTPYVAHVIGVMVLLSSATHDEDILIAGLLHDTLEDVEHYTPEHIEEAFGPRVKEIVLGVTEKSKLDGDRFTPWKDVKQAYLEVLRNAPPESVMVSLADKIQNTRSLIEMIHKAEGGHLPKFGSSHEDRIWFHEAVLKIGEERLGEGHILVDEMKMELDEMKKALEKFK